MWHKLFFPRMRVSTKIHLARGRLVLQPSRMLVSPTVMSIRPSSSSFPLRMNLPPCTTCRPFWEFNHNAWLLPVVCTVWEAIEYLHASARWSPYLSIVKKERICSFYLVCLGRLDTSYHLRLLSPTTSTTIDNYVNN